jgi:hypothetical protein
MTVSARWRRSATDEVSTRLLARQARRVSVFSAGGQISGRAAEAQMVRTGIRRQR